MITNRRNEYGLTERDVQTIREIIKKYSDVKEVQLFGSRAQGNYKYGSDVDLAIMNKDVSPKTIANLISDFEESSLPYRVDLVNYATLKHKQLIDHIDRIGIVFYELERKGNYQVKPV